jgi:L-fucose isomerase-like protein
MKAKVKVIFPALKQGEPGWPYIDYDYTRRTGEIISKLEENIPEIEFSKAILYSPEEARKMLDAEKGNYDGYLVYLTTLWTGIPEFTALNYHPVIVADELFSGSGGFINTHSLIKREKLPVVSIASSNFKDIVDGVKLFPVIKKMKNSRILTVFDEEGFFVNSYVINKIKEIFGTEVLQMKSEEINSYYREVDVSEAEKIKTKWIREAVKVVEPSEDEILESAKLFLAIKKAMDDKNADAVTVDCLSLCYEHKLPAYPCLSFFQLNNDGLTGVCEADLEAAITQLLIRYLTGRPGYISDPVIDVATNQIIYAHCVATNRVYGPDGLANPYVIRSHAEDRRGASVQSLMPLEETVTTVKVSLDKAFAIHQGKTIANVEQDKGCRTKLAAGVEAEKILERYHFELFKWHLVTCYGDFRKQFINLATLYGLEIFEQDK